VTDELDLLRKRVAEIDEDIAAFVAKRLQAVAEIGRLKGEQRIPVRDERVEAQVVQRLETAGRRHGLSDIFARDLARALIEESVRVQDASVRPPPDDAGRRILIVGGAGRMGSWLARYFRGQSERVVINDIAGPLDGFLFAPDLAPAVRDADVIVVATSMSAAVGVLRSVTARRPAGLVFDICSLKAPVREALLDAARAGLRVASVHPMFGPTVASLAGRNILFCDCGNREALEAATDLFRGTGANLAEVPLDRHDALIARVLGLSHAANIAFFHALARGGVAMADLRDASSTTFSRQVATAREVANENPDLYLEIQALNPHTREVVRDLEAALAELRAVVARGDVEAFRSLMESGRRYFGGD
jgi:chorismate mutase/prephenate dehydrogenase